MIHNLTIHPCSFELVRTNLKHFIAAPIEVDYKKGEIICIQEFIPKGYYDSPLLNDCLTGRNLFKKIDFIQEVNDFDDFHFKNHCYLLWFSALQINI